MAQRQLPVWGLTMSVILQAASPQQASLETIGARLGEDSSEGEAAILLPCLGAL